MLGYIIAMYTRLWLSTSVEYRRR